MEAVVGCYTQYLNVGIGQRAYSTTSVRGRLVTSDMSVRYHCPHENDPTPPLDPSYASSSSSFSSLDALYFCEECDAIRCNTCVAVEVASYFCPSCLFDVPSANVRADKNRYILTLDTTKDKRSVLNEQMRATLLSLSRVQHLYRSPRHLDSGGRSDGRGRAIRVGLQRLQVDK